MEKKFVPYPIALVLKELGYDGEVCGLYRGLRLYPIMGFEKINSVKHSVIAAPLWQDAIDWFREKHNIYIWIYYDIILENSYYQIRHEVNKSSYHHYTNENAYNNMHEIDYPTSREHAILKAIEIIKKK